MEPVAVIPAAGRAERFGGQKALADVDGKPMLGRVIEVLRKAEINQIVVVLGEDEDAIRQRVAELKGCTIVRNPKPERGMFSSLQLGFDATPATDQFIVVIGDMPFVRPATITALLAEHGKVRGVVSPRYQGKRGHPLVVDPGVRLDVLTSPAEGITFHEVLKRHADRRHDLDVDDPGVLHDVDTAADLEARAG